MFADILSLVARLRASPAPHDERLGEMRETTTTEVLLDAANNVFSHLGRSQLTWFDRLWTDGRYLPSEAPKGAILDPTTTRNPGECGRSRLACLEEHKSQYHLVDRDGLPARIDRAECMINILSEGTIRVCRNWNSTGDRCREYNHVKLPSSISVGDVFRVRYSSNPKSYEFHVGRMRQMAALARSIHSLVEIMCATASRPLARVAAIHDQTDAARESNDAPKRIRN